MRGELSMGMCHTKKGAIPVAVDQIHINFWDRVFPGWIPYLRFLVRQGKDRG